MSKLGKALLEATQDDMGSDPISREAELIRQIIDRNSNASVDDAISLGWAVHDIHTSVNRLNAFDGDLSVIAEELDFEIARLSKIAAKAKK